LGADDADIDRALLEDAVAGQKPLDIVDRLRKAVAKGEDVGGKTRREVHMNPARAEIIGVQPSAGRALVKLHQPFAFLESPKKRGQRPDIEPERANVEQVVENARDF